MHAPNYLFPDSLVHTFIHAASSLPNVVRISFPKALEAQLVASTASFFGWIRTGVMYTADTEGAALFDGFADTTSRFGIRVPQVHTSLGVVGRMKGLPAEGEQRDRERERDREIERERERQREREADRERETDRQRERETERERERVRERE
jgi:hypothetical protein